ncbi:hypothetical protein ACFOW6_06945 [Fodinicurvata halophila]|uniref:Uncharacterized protein n=1 Tax=Fodinicurvata halophila TaxID=1419723 RepID=A0ABV8UJ27_9PROT
MKRTLRYGLLAGASGLALGFGLATAPAQAFDEVDWTWTSEVNTDFTIDPEIVWQVDPEGLVMVESIQVSVGDITATSTVSGVHNNQPEGTGYADGSFTFESEIFDDDYVDGLDFNKGVYDGETSGEVAGIQPGAQTESTFGSTDDSGDVGDLDSGVYDATGALDGATVSVHGGIAPDGGSCNNEPPGEQGCVIFTVDIEDMYIIGDAALDAVIELPEVVSVATAVANNLSVTADAGTLMHNGQYAFGEFNAPETGDITYKEWEYEKEWEYWYKDIGRRSVSLGGGDGSASGSGEYFHASGDLANAALAAAGISQVDTGNRHHDVLATATILAALGLIEQGNVTAESDVSDILNSSVDSNATAVSNNISVSVNPGEETEVDGETTIVSGPAIDNLLVADYTQFSYMNVESTSTVDNVGVNNYVNLGSIDRPLVNSTATSVGNNISVNVGN